MLVKFKENRVRRAYFGGKRIDRFYGKVGENTRYPEEWLASTTEAFNPDMPKAGEGLSLTDDGRIFRDFIGIDRFRRPVFLPHEKHNGKKRGTFTIFSQ